MNDPHQSAELQQLREQVAAITRRVYQLEQMLARGTQPIPPPQGAIEAATEPVPPPPAIAEPVPLSPEPLQAPAEPKITPTSTTPPPTAAKKPSPPSGASLESRIGGQWLNRIGIVAVLVGLSYFLKLAFENGWIGPAAQVIVGLVAGLGILFWSERFRAKGYPAFAYSLKAVSFGALYLSLWAASQYYHLVPATVTFFGMVMVTLTAAALSLRQNAELLAAFALAGGLLTPILVSTGENHEIALLSYLLLLDLGTLWMVAVKGWRRLLLGSFLGTVMLFAAWATTYYSEPQLLTTVIFASLFLLLYVAAPFVGEAPPRRQYATGLTVVAVFNPAAYFIGCYLMMERHDRLELLWLTIAAAALYLVLLPPLRRREQPDTPLFEPLYLAIAIGFITVAIPLKLEDHWLTLGWLVEAGALFWAAHRGKSMLLRMLGSIALFLGVVRLVFVDSDAPQPLLLNPRFGLYLLAIAVLGLLAYITKSEGGEDNLQWSAAAILALNVLALIALHFEVIEYFRPAPNQPLAMVDWRSLHIARDFTYSAVWMIYGSALMLAGFWKRSAFLRWQAIALLALTAAKVFFYDINTLERGYRIAAFIVLGAILLAVSFFYQRARVKAAE